MTLTAMTHVPCLDTSLRLALPDEEEVTRLVRRGGTLRVVVDGELVEVAIERPADARTARRATGWRVDSQLN